MRLEFHSRNQDKELFPAADQDRIRLLDNTDISQALIGTNVGTTQGHPRPLDVLGIIALRLYVVMGKQIQEWRDMGQIGLIDGLHRNTSGPPGQGDAAQDESPSGRFVFRLGVLRLGAWA